MEGAPQYVPSSKRLCFQSWIEYVLQGSRCEVIRQVGTEIIHNEPRLLTGKELHHSKLLNKATYPRLCRILQNWAIRSSYAGVHSHKHRNSRLILASQLDCEMRGVRMGQD